MSKPTNAASLPGLAALQQAIDAGDMATVRRSLSRLSADERDALRAELGDEQYALVYRLIRRARRSIPKGHVVFLHGIMGATLAVRRGRDKDGVWINYWRLATGRMADLRLDTSGAPADPDAEVLVTGLHRKSYLPMLLQLDQQWAVKPFAYDWRHDIHASAARLAETIRQFADGKPVHLVAHSMGGLVARCMILDHPDLWQRLADGNQLRRGGRLIMLGTPNHGSYAIPLALTGEDRMVKLLAKLDLKHGMNALLDITNSFPGSYQMLPSPHIDAGDDHADLYDTRQWARRSIRAKLLARARAFHDALQPIIDRERFGYVAGYNQDTPHRIRIDAPGKFQYQTTLAGDGRVPHEFGLLDGVPTWWTEAAHGDLARDKGVLAAIDALLETGASDDLADTRPVSRTRDLPAWQAPAAIAPADPLALELLQSETRSAGARKSRLGDAERGYIEQALVADYLGGGARAPRAAGNADAPARPRPRLVVDVVWGDITRCDGDVFAVGHYQGVLPQKAEQALDAQVSGDPDYEHVEQHVLRQHTLRGMLRGALGDVDFFPWHSDTAGSRTVAVAGMGRIGCFSATDARLLARKLTWAVAGLRGANTVCTVLIGSGEGALTLNEALRAMLLGIGDALRSEPGAGRRPAITTLRIAEIYRHRAEAIYAYLREHADTLSQHVDLQLPPRLSRGDNRLVSPEDALALVIDSVLAQDRTLTGKRDRAPLEKLLKSAARGVPISLMRKAIRTASDRLADDDARSGYYVSAKPRAARSNVPFRLSYLNDGGDIRAAAISDAATVPERVLRLDRSLVDSVAAEVNDPDRELRDETPGFLRRLLLPDAFVELIERGESFVFEVDRDMAQVPWEILATSVDEPDALPLAVRAAVSRQLRTSYSGGPQLADARPARLRALVIGDPGDPARGDDLPGAAEEAFAVAALLRQHGVSVDLMVGAEGARRNGRLADVPAATRSAVMERLMLGDYQLLHFAGHADFVARDATQAGWLFADGLLTAYELERVSEVPALVFANACLTGRTSQRGTGGPVRRARDEAGLLPSLADEFFRRGAVDYIGSAWEISDAGAVLFATTLYETLLGAPETSQSFRALGDAVRTARVALWERRDEYGKLWAAYQHYGDPSSPFRRPPSAV